MFFFSIKALFYITIFFFTAYGILSLKTLFSQKEEGFTEEEEERTVSRTSLDSTSSKSSQQDISCDVMEELSNKINTSFNALKDSLTKQMDSTKELIDNNIKELVSQQTQDDENAKTPSNLPSVKSFQLENTELSDEENSEVDEEESELDDDEINEPFENGGYNGVTSPYCLNCFSYT